MLRDRLARQTGLTSTALTNAVRELVEVGALQEVEVAPRGGRGRPPHVLRIAGDGAVSIGIAVREFHVDIAAINLSHQIVARRTIPHSMRLEGSDEEKALGDMMDGVESLLDEIGDRPLLGVGLTASAQLGPDGRSFEEVNDFASFGQYQRLVEMLEERIGESLSVLGDVDAAILAERWASKSQASDNMMYLNDRLGFSILWKGEPFAGLGATRWLGQYPLQPGIRAAMPQFKGCLVYTASLPSITDRLAGYEYGTRPPMTEAESRREYAAAFRRYEAGEERVVELFHQAFDQIGHALRALAVLFVIGQVVLEGWTDVIRGVAIARIQAVLDEGHYGHLAKPRAAPRVISARLGEDQQVVGAAIGVIEDKLHLSGSSRRENAVMAECDI
ncbi:MAG: ROK family protein [Phycisphaerales bacterium]